MSSNPKGKHLMNGKETWNGFDKNPQNIWTNPKKGVSLFLQQCKDNNIVAPTKQDIEATYMNLVNMNIEELKLVAKDEIQPFIVRKICEFIIKAKDLGVYETLLDRGIGKPLQSLKSEVGVTWEIKIIKPKL